MIGASSSVLSLSLALGSPGGEVANAERSARGDDAISMATPDDSPGPPEGARILDVRGSGSGCPPGRVTAMVSNDDRGLLIGLPDMTASHPPGPVFQNINCLFAITLEIPAGWQLASTSVQTRGFAHLPAGTFAEQRSNYVFSGYQLGIFRNRLDGYFDGEYSFTDDIGFVLLVWSSCGGQAILTINEALRLDTAGNRDDDAFVNSDHIDAMLRKKVSWVWHRCV